MAIRSTPESIAQRRISLLALVEVTVATGIYWWVAIYFETHLHLFVSIIALPLLLLRSDESNELADQMWLGDLSQTEPQYSKIQVVLFLTLILGLFVAFLCLYLCVIGKYWDVFQLWNLSVAIAVSVLACIHRVTSREGMLLVLFKLPKILEKGGKFRRVVEILAALSLVGWVLGIVLTGLLIRISSTIWNCRSGIERWRDNWYRTMFCEDAFVQPYLIPDLPSKSGLRLGVFKDLVVEAGGMMSLRPTLSLHYFIHVMIYLLWVSALCVGAIFVLATAQLWRWSIKSTCWFYIPAYLLLSICLLYTSPSPRDQRGYRMPSSA